MIEIPSPGCDDGQRQPCGMFEALAGISPLAVFMLDERARVIRWNVSAEAILGWTEAELLGKPLPAIPVELRDEFDGIHRRIFNGEALAGVEATWNRQDGTPIETRLHAAPVRDAAGNVCAVMAVIGDSSEHRKLEGQLRDAQKFEAFGTLTGGIVHDFNNILTAILGHGKLLELKLPAEGEAAFHLRQILSASGRATELTRSLLDFCRKPIVEPRPIDLSGLVRRMERFLAKLLRENIRFTTRVSEVPVTVLADAGQIEQVLMNLVVNAVDAMPDGGTLEIGTALRESVLGFIDSHGSGNPGRCAVIEVADSGVGMDPSTRERIFEPFFSTKDAGKGTGLGLSIAHGIVKQHGGYIQCESEPGRGSTFRICLPGIPDAPTAGKPASTETPRGGAETILLAEDDAMVRVAIRETLTRHGYTVLEAADGEEAIAKAREHGDRIRLAILDLVMPRMSGRQACDGLEKLLSGLPMLFFSGYPSDERADPMAWAARRPVLPKPVEPARLLKAVRDLLDGKGVPGSPGSSSH